jgi:hypothetical protein
MATFTAGESKRLQLLVERKNGKPHECGLPLGTQDDSVLELFYKDLVQPYDLKEGLIHEGLSDYATHRLSVKTLSTILH